MPEQSLINRRETKVVDFSPYYTRPPTHELLMFKKNNGLEVTESEKNDYNEYLGVEGKQLLIMVREEQEQIRTELESLRESNKGVKDKIQRRQNMLVTMNMSNELTQLIQKEESIIEEIYRLEMI